VIRVAAAIAGAAVVMFTAAAQVPSHERLPLQAVVVGAVISQPFGCTSLELEPFDPFCPGRHIHTGVDLAAPPGTEVHSATAGVASTGFDSSGAGNYAAVAAGPHVRILYCHLSAFRVRPGEPVLPGQVIGLVGATGLATGPHVHFQVDIDGTAVDPALWLIS
jgi:murein DD-endopeptidase MepM/ murein hydrolase activator NlpD